MTKDDPKGSFIRWQAITIAQLTYSVNLILSFSVAALAFQVSILLNERFIPEALQKCMFSISLILLIVATGLGIWCVINRLRDFRATMKVARMREEGKSDEEMQPYRMLYKRLGKRTWLLFWWQIGAFGVGVLLLAVSITASLSQKLM